MPISTTYKSLARIALDEFGDIVAQAEELQLPTGDPRKLRLRIVDGSIVEERLRRALG